MKRKMGRRGTCMYRRREKRVLREKKEEMDKGREKSPMGGIR